MEKYKEKNIYNKYGCLCEKRDSCKRIKDNKGKKKEKEHNHLIM